MHASRPISVGNVRNPYRFPADARRGCDKFCLALDLQAARPPPTNSKPYRFAAERIQNSLCREALLLPRRPQTQRNPYRFAASWMKARARRWVSFCCDPYRFPLCCVIIYERGPFQHKPGYVDWRIRPYIYIYISLHTRT